MSSASVPSTSSTSTETETYVLSIYSGLVAQDALDKAAWDELWIKVTELNLKIFEEGGTGICPKLVKYDGKRQCGVIVVGSRDQEDGYKKQFERIGEGRCRAWSKDELIISRGFNAFK